MSRGRNVCPVVKPQAVPCSEDLREVIGVSPAVHVLQLLQILSPAFLLVYPAHSFRLPPRQLLFGQRLLGFRAYGTPVVNRHFRLHVPMRRLCDGRHGPLVCAHAWESAYVGRGSPSLDSWHFRVSPTYIRDTTKGNLCLSLPSTSPWQGREVATLRYIQPRPGTVHKNQRAWMIILVCLQFRICTQHVRHSASFICFVPCIVIYHQIEHQQNAHVSCISFHAPTCFGPIIPSSGCFLLQNTLLFKCASIYIVRAEFMLSVKIYIN